MSAPIHAVRSTLVMARKPMSKATPSRVKGAPIITRGYAVTSYDDEVRVSWNPGMGDRSPEATDLALIEAERLLRLNPVLVVRHDDTFNRLVVTRAA